MKVTFASMMYVAKYIVSDERIAAPTSADYVRTIAFFAAVILVAAPVLNVVTNLINDLVWH